MRSDLPITAYSWDVSNVTPSVASNGQDYLVVWNDGRNSKSTGSDIYAARVAGDGTLLDPDGMPINHGSSNQANPEVASNGTGYLVVWEEHAADPHDTPDVYGARVSREGIVQEPDGIPIKTTGESQSHPAVASNREGYFVAWQERGSTPDILGARVTNEGKVRDTGILLSAIANNHAATVIATNGDNYLLVWEEERWSDTDLLGVRVSKAGEVLDPSGLALSTAENKQSRPAVASNGTDYLVLWEDSRTSPGLSDIKARQVSGAGVMGGELDISPSSSGHESAPAVASDGTDYLVVWEDWRNLSTSSTDEDIYGARVTKDGGVLDPEGLPIRRASSRQARPALAFNGTDYLVAWQDSGGSTAWDIQGTRVSRTGGVLDDGLLLCGEARSQVLPSVASDGGDFLVTWEDLRASTSRADIYATRVTAGGTVQDPRGFALTTAPKDHRAATTVYDGANYFVAWLEQGMDGWDLTGTQVSSTGAISPPEGLALAADSTNEVLPVLVPAGPARYFLVYHRFEQSGGFSSTQAQGHLFTLP